MEAVGFAREYKALAELYKTGNIQLTRLKLLKINLLEAGKGFFKNYDADTDKKLFVALMTLYGENVDPAWQAPELCEVQEFMQAEILLRLPTSSIQLRYLPMRQDSRNLLRRFSSVLHLKAG